MTLRRRDVLKVLAASATAGFASKEASAASRTLKRDVVIVGGGSAGTYAALRLRDLGHSVAVVEPSARLGGHAETYYDPATSLPIDIGVIVFPDNALVRNYFGRFSQPLLTANFSGGVDHFVDFRSGQPVDAFDPSPAEVGGALFRYSQILASRYSFLEESGFQLPASGPVLQELLQPFGQFVQSNGLEALVPTFFRFVQGFGPLLEATTLYVLKNMSLPVVGGSLNNSFLLAPFGTSSLYGAATTELGEDALLGASIQNVDREGRSRVRVRLRTPSGNLTISAKRLLFTAPPLLSNLAGFDLDYCEFAVLSRFRSHAYWTGVMRLEGIPAGMSLVNTAPDTPFNLAPLPGIYSIGPSAVPDLYNVKYGSSHPLSDAAVKTAIATAVRRARLPGGVRPVFQGFTTFKSHTPYSLVASPALIRSGFYSDLQALQGRNDTFYAGAAFETHNSAAIWNFLENLVPTMFA
jgi:hypothetical protein